MEHRPVAEICAEIDATQARLDALLQERAASLAARRAAIVAAFDGGATRADIMARFGLDYGALGTLLHKAGRSERQRRAADLSRAQRAHYERLVRQGVRSSLARVIAQAVAL
jgi:imidazolonepropionase-like amidohydrolase